MRLKNKVALVTGGGQGVGRGIALALASEGADVAVTGRTQKKLDDCAAELEQRGVRALALACDVKNAEQLASTVNSVTSTLGGPNILVNNAQEVPMGHLSDLTEDALQGGWESGPLATFRLMKLCYPHLKGGGNIINLASSAAMRWDPDAYGGYGAVKEAIRQLTRTAACEWGVDGIRSNCIVPLANSPGMQWWTNEHPEEAAEFTASLPMQRIGDCEADIGRFVATLCSDDCQYVNGQTIGLDGGQAPLG